VFQGSLAVAIMIDGSQKPNRQLGFELQSSHVIEKRNKLFVREADLSNIIRLIFFIYFR